MAVAREKAKAREKKGEGKGEGKSGADKDGDDDKPDEEAEDFVANFGSAASVQKRHLNTEGQIDFPKNGTDDNPAHHGHHGHHGKKHCGHHRRHHKSIFGTANQELFGTRFPVLETSILAVVLLSVLACLLRRGSPLRKLLSKCVSKHRRGGSRNNRDFGSGASGRSATTSETTTQQGAAGASLDETSDADSQTSETTPRKPRGDNNTTAPANDGQNDGPSRTISTRSVFSAGAASGAGDSTSRTAYPQVVVVTTADEGQQVLYQQPTTAVIQTLQPHQFVASSAVPTASGQPQQSTEGQAALSTPAPRPVPVVFSQNISH